jgi:hypothetical protein
MPKKPKPLTREGEPTQRTSTGLEIPVPTRDDFFKPLKGATKKSPAPPSAPDQAAR